MTTVTAPGKTVSIEINARVTERLGAEIIKRRRPGHGKSYQWGQYSERHSKIHEGFAARVPWIKRSPPIKAPSMINERAASTLNGICGSIRVGEIWPTRKRIGIGMAENNEAPIQVEVNDDCGAAAVLSFIRRAPVAELSFEELFGLAICVVAVMTITAWSGGIRWLLRNADYVTIQHWLWLPLAIAIGYTTLLTCFRHRALMLDYRKLKELLSLDGHDKEKAQELRKRLDEKRALYKMIGEVFAAMSVVGAAISLVSSYHSFDDRFIRVNAISVPDETTMIDALSKRACNPHPFNVTACAQSKSIPGLTQAIRDEKDSVLRRSQMLALSDSLQPLLSNSDGPLHEQLQLHMNRLDAAIPNEALFALLQMIGYSALIVAVMIAVSYKLALAIYEYRIVEKAGQPRRSRA
jgi:hypothetical protein